jgi:FtsP/CotA-like multicopper oxidase with cupredoxin domain
MDPKVLLDGTKGDQVRVVLDNQLPESTAIHFHGIEVPNAMDGVPYVTQDPVKPGETFTYDFVAQGPAVGMYHSHHHAEHQVPDGSWGRSSSATSRCRPAWPCHRKCRWC